MYSCIDEREIENGTNNFHITQQDGEKKEYMVRQLVEALRYKPEVRCFDSRWVNCICRWINPSARTMARGCTQPLAEMSSMGIFWEEGVKTAGA